MIAYISLTQHHSKEWNLIQAFLKE